jgi:hypothetical protein
MRAPKVSPGRVLVAVRRAGLICQDCQQTRSGEVYWGTRGVTRPTPPAPSSREEAGPPRGGGMGQPARVARYRIP